MTKANYPHGIETLTGSVHLEAGKPYSWWWSLAAPAAGLRICSLMWAKIDRSMDPAAVAAAKNADVVVAVVGITSELEGEEMLVNEPGFKGGDRTSLDLPEPEQDLLEAVAKAGKPMVVVLTNGSALGGELGQGTRQCDSRCMVSGRRGRNCRGADALWQATIPPAGCR